MKRLVCLLGGCWLLVSAFAQTSSLTVTTGKTTSLIFPYPVVHVDRGTGEILVQQVREAGNVLLVKAASGQFPETNLSVITSDGEVYMFRVSYATDPVKLVWYIPVQKEATLETYCRGMLDNKRTLHGIGDHNWDIAAKLLGIYSRGNIMYYQLSLENRGAIDYDIELLKFYIRDKQKGKRTAVQENELTPLYIAGNHALVKAGTTNIIVVALDKYTIPDKKYLAIQILEKNGGRHLLLRVHNNKIIRAIPLPGLQ